MTPTRWTQAQLLAAEGEGESGRLGWFEEEMEHERQPVRTLADATSSVCTPGAQRRDRVVLARSTDCAHQRRRNCLAAGPRVAAVTGMQRRSL